MIRTVDILVLLTAPVAMGTQVITHIFPSLFDALTIAIQLYSCGKPQIGVGLSEMSKKFSAHQKVLQKSQKRHEDLYTERSANAAQFYKGGKKSWPILLSNISCGSNSSTF